MKCPRIAVTGAHAGANIPSIHRSHSLSLLLALAALLAACGATTPASRVSTTNSERTARTAPSGFTVQPDIVNKRCNGGRGARLATHGWKEPVIATGTMPDGSMLTAFTQIYPGKNFAVLDSVTSKCAPNRTFGDAGTEKIRIPPRLVPAHSADNDYLWILAVAARNGGGAIVAGTYRNRWVVGALTPAGGLNHKFGTDGWTALPLHGEATAALQLRSGRIVVGGDNDGGGCCTINHAAAVSSHGQVERRFGNDGRVKLPTGEDSGVESLAREPNGDILAKVGFGNMGCWGVAVAMLTPSGQPVPHFAERLTKFWRRQDFGAFVGDVYITHRGFTLAGTGQRSCAEGPRFSSKSATGLLARFRTNGVAAAPAIRFPSKLYGSVAAFKAGADTLLAESTYTDATRLTLRLLRPGGSTAKAFGRNGRVRIRTPWRGSDAAIDTEVSVIKADPRSLAVVATEDERKQLQVARVHF
jgi:hypothetical protein